MKIAILTLGTRGDVQPYAVLEKALKERGHEVTLSTAKTLKALLLLMDWILCRSRPISNHYLIPNKAKRSGRTHSWRRSNSPSLSTP